MEKYFLPPRIKSRLVQPSATVGLNEELADSAIRILKSSNKELVI